MLLSINNFGPFEADVWGTVSEWVMVVVTLGTGIAIILTFLEQRKVTESQLKLQEIETDRYRKEIRPRFELKNERKPYTFAALPSVYFIQELSIVLNDNSLIDFTLKITECVGYEWYNKTAIDGLSIETINSKWAIGLQFKFESLDGQLPKQTFPQCHIIFELTYKDLKTNLYRQTLVFVPELSQQCYTNEPLLIQAAN